MYQLLRGAAALAVLLAAVPSIVLSHQIQLPAHGRECFHENLHRDDRMTVTYQVGDREFGSAGNLDIDFWVCDGRLKSHVSGALLDSSDMGRD